jgi:predicted amidohydrolase YtcJ
MPKFRLILATWVLVLLPGSLAFATGQEAGPADVIFQGGEVYTANPKAPWASAVAVRGKRIIYVGDESGLGALLGPTTRRFQLNGKLVLPGMVDAHTHPGMVAQTVDNVTIRDAHSREDLLQAVADMVADNPDQPFLIGGFWNNELFDVNGPHKRDLDRIEPKRPLILYDYWAHTIWANSKALEAVGVDKNTPDILADFAYYQRDESGEATGYITESAASLFINHFEPMTAQVEQALFDFLVYLRNLGVMTVMDAGNFGLDEQTYAVISRWDREGKLPLRYHATYTLFMPGEVNTAVNTLQQLNEKYGGDRLRIDTLKIFLDGIIANRTADMSSDYLDTPGRSGNSLLNRQQLRQLILELNAAGLNLHVHTVGNQSARTMLDAVQDAHETLGEAPAIRIALCHLEIVDDEDFSRFKELGVIANYTPQWHGWGADENSLPGIGEKAYSMMRAQPIISDGGVVNFSSDITDVTEWKSERANPFLGMQVGHNRQDVEGGPDAPIATPISERLQLDDLVNGYTRHGAYQLAQSEELGSIEVGKFADLVVLDQNLFEVNRYEIHKIRPVAVVMEGEIVFGSLSERP